MNSKKKADTERRHQNFSKKIYILGHALIQILLVIHHFLDSPFYNTEMNSNKMTKKGKQCDDG